MYIILTIVMIVDEVSFVEYDFLINRVVIILFIFPSVMHLVTTIYFLTSFP